MTSPVRQVEQAILQQLRAVQRAYTGLMVESYAGQLDDEMFEWIRRLPATWVTFDQVPQSKRVGVHSWIMDGSFEVLCAQRTLRENDARLNDATKGAAVGVYELLEDNKLALVNQKLGLPIDPIQPGAIRPVMKGMVKGEPIAIYAQAFHTRWQEVYPDPDSVPAGTLVTVGLNYFLRPDHNPATDLPDKTDIATTNP